MRNIFYILILTLFSARIAAAQQKNLNLKNCCHRIKTISRNTSPFTRLLGGSMDYTPV